MRALFFVIIAFGFSSYPALAQDNADLEQLYELDKAGRQTQPINREELHAEDTARRESVLSILQAGGIRTASDYLESVPYLSSTPTVQSAANPTAQVERDPLIQQLGADFQQRGIELTSPDTSRIEWLRAAPGLGYRVGSGWLHVHVYPDTAAAKANADQIPASADTGATDWVAPPHFFQCDRIIALYLGQDEKVTTALTELCGPRFAGFQN